MAPTLYSCELSPPARSVLLAAKAIGLELNVVEVDLGKREQMTPEFLKVRKTMDQINYHFLEISGEQNLKLFGIGKLLI